MFGLCWYGVCSVFDVVVVKQSDGSFQATTLQVKIGKMTNIKTIFRSREGRKAQLQVNNVLVLPETTIEIGDSGNAFFLRSENGRNFTFTSDELAEMNLNDGLNEAIFVVEELNIRLNFSIFLLNQGNRLVFTDVDGTITTADIKGYIAGELGFDICSCNSPIYIRKDETISLIQQKN
jgi:phosphatidate phosphatase PAH1